MSKILVIAEHAKGKLDDSAAELLTAARALAGEGDVVAAVLLGHEVAGQAAVLAKGYDAVHVFDDPRLAVPDGEADGLVLAALIERERPRLTLAVHTNRAIDLVPALAARLDVPLLGDCLALAWRDDRLTAVRTLYGGKIHASFVTAPSPQGFLATVRGGAFAAAPFERTTPGSVHAESMPDPFAPRRRTLRTVEAEVGEVDISQAQALVAIGRGLEDAEQLEIVRDLADALGAEVCCSRPIVDKGWLPKNRQVGTSGVEVRPKVYVALGISGSFQHLGGIKGGPYLVAVNKDRGAPIFQVADVGIVGDLAEVAPAIAAAVRKAKG